MISSASTLLLATLVFNAATVLSAPIRMDISEPIARSSMSTPVQPVARAVTVDAREPAVVPAVEKRERRYPRRVHYDFYEKREPAAASAPAIQLREPVVEERERRYPRRVHYDFYKRDPATSVKENLTWNKVTVFDTPADAAAFKGTGDAGAAPPAASDVPVAPVAQVAPAGTDAPAAPAAVNPAAPSADGSPTPSPDAGTPAADGAATPSSTCVPPSASNVSCPAPSVTATDAASATATTAASDASATATDAAATATATASATDATTTATATDASAAPSATDAPATEQRRWVKAASSQPVARRALAASGATWASAVRRQLNQ